MIVIETCPVCGSDLHDLVVCTYPPISQKCCLSCGYTWESEREEIVRIPFSPKEKNTTINFEGRLL